MKQASQAQALAAGLPALLLAAERLAQAATLGQHGRRLAGQGEDFWQFRGFAAGDEARQIDWRRSASGANLLVREREWAAPARLALRLDNSPGMRFKSGAELPAKWDRAALLLLALAWAALQAGEHVALAGRTPPLSGRGALQALGQALISDASAPPDPKARCVIFGDFLTSMPAFASATGGAVVQVLDPAECDFPYTGRVMFEGFTGETPMEAPRAQDWRSAYLVRLAALRAQVAATAGKAGQTVLFHRTDSKPLPVLAALIHALAGH